MFTLDVYKIYARKCQIKLLQTSEANRFYQDNHLQGPIFGQNMIHIGLEYNNEIVSLMTLGSSRFTNKYEWELLRFCNKLYTIVPGGLSKLFKYFVKNYNPTSIICYIERRLGIPSKGYEYCGFEHLGYSELGYWYVDLKNSLKRESRLKYQKHKLKNILENFNPNLSGDENMRINGFRKIWDCGQLIYLWTK